MTKEILISSLFPLLFISCKENKPNPIIGLKKGLWLPTEQTLVPRLELGMDTITYRPALPFIISPTVTSIQTQSEGSYSHSILQNTSKDWIIEYFGMGNEWIISTNQDTLIINIATKGAEVQTIYYTHVLTESNTTISSLEDLKVNLDNTSWIQKVSNEKQRFIRLRQSDKIDTFHFPKDHNRLQIPLIQYTINNNSRANFFDCRKFISFYYNKSQQLFFAHIYFLEDSETIQKKFIVKKISRQKDTIIFCPVNQISSFHNKEIVWISPSNKIAHLDSITEIYDKIEKDYKESIWGQ